MAIKIKRRRRFLGRMLLAASLFVGACESEDTANPATEAKTAQESGEAMPAGAEPTSVGQIAAPSRARKMAMDAPAPAANTENYTDYGVNPWTATAEDRLSTFAVDVDTASYAIARRKILEGVNPPPASVRVEEFVNYFKYNYRTPEGAVPFSVDFAGSPAPRDSSRHIVRVGIQGKSLEQVQRKPVHLTFLVDVSGSMGSHDKLPLAKKALHLLVEQLQQGDTVSLVTYAGNTRVVLEPTGMDERARIRGAIEDLNSGGGTAMGSGMTLAYEQAHKTLAPGHESRVIVLSDGDANIGRTGHDAILDAISGYVEEGVTMSVIGLGMGNYQDTRMEQLANKGNGNYYYIDDVAQAKRVFVEQLGGTLQVIAMDVKIQVEFDPNVVEKYRLIGYENRDIADNDFRDDKVDAGEIGAGHQVTALYELELKEGGQGDLGVVRIRHKAPEGDVASENAFTLGQDALAASFDEASSDLRFAMAVVTFAEILRSSPEVGQRGFAEVLEMAREAAGENPERLDFIELVKRAEGQKG